MHALPFPPHWAGTWVDPTGRMLKVEGSGKWLEVTICAGKEHPPFPIPGMPGHFTENLPAFLRENETHGLCIDVQPGDPDFHPRYLLALVVEVDQRLRPALLTDEPHRLHLLPVILEGMAEAPSPTAMSWAFPLLRFTRTSL